MVNRDAQNKMKAAIRDHISAALSNIQAEGRIGNFYLTEKEFLVFKEKRQFIIKVTANTKSNYFGDSLDITETFRNVDMDKRDLNYNLFQKTADSKLGLRMAHIGSYEFVLKDDKNQEYTVKISAIRNAD